MSQSKVLVLFYSRDGATEAMANAVAEGAGAAGAEVRIRRVREFVGPETMAKAAGWAENAERMNALYEAPTHDDLVWADAIIFGSPTRFGGVAAELKAFIDTLGGLWAKGALYGKVGGAFTATATPHGGNESTILTVFNIMSHLGLVIVPPGYGDPAAFAAGTPYGASTVGASAAQAPSEAELTIARLQGRRAAEVSDALVAAAK